MATQTRRDIRAILYYNFAHGLSKEEYFKEMSEVFDEDFPSVRTVEHWNLHFQRGSFVLEDQRHTGRPSDIATPELVDAVWKAITINRRIT